MNCFASFFGVVWFLCGSRKTEGLAGDPRSVGRDKALEVGRQEAPVLLGCCNSVTAWL